MSSPELESCLRTIAQSKPELITDEDGFAVYLPCTHNLDRPNKHALIAGDLREHNGKSSAYLSQFEVDSPLDGHGIGSRLLKVFLKYCDSQNIEVVTSEITSSTAMHIKRRVLGEEALHFTENVEGQEVELPMSMDQACLSIDRAWGHWRDAYHEGENTDDISVGIDTKVYLTDIDTSSWEMPIPSC